MWIYLYVFIYIVKVRYVTATKTQNMWSVAHCHTFVTYRYTYNKAIDNVIGTIAILLL